MGKALGLIEFIGYVPAVCAADIALKSANVDLIGIEKVTGGIVTVKLTGDVDAVQAAVESAESFASRIGSLRSAHVIPRLDDEVEALLMNEKKERERLIKLEDEVNEEAEIAIQNEAKLQEEIQESESEIKDETMESEITIQVEIEEVKEEKNEEDIELEIKKFEKIEEEIKEEVREEFVEMNEESDSEINNSEKDVVEDIKKESNDDEEVSKEHLDREEKTDESEIDIKKISKMRVKDLRKKVKILNPTINTNKLKSLKKKDLVEILLKHNKEGES